MTLDRPSRLARGIWYLSILLLACVTAAAALLWSLLAAPIALVGAGIAVLPWRITFTRLPQARARRVRRKAVAAARTQHKHAAAQLKWQLDARELSIAAYQRELDALTDRRMHIERESAGEYARIDRWRDQELAKLVRERTSLQGWTSRQLSRRTAAVEARHVSDQLARHRIDGAMISGIGRGVAAELEAVGIRTAADFQGIRYKTGFGQSTTVVIRHRDGRELRVPMVGVMRARNLETWRDGLAARARNTMPAHLTAPIRSQLAAETASRESGIAAREGAVKSAADVQRRTALNQTQSQREALAADEQSTRSSHAAAVAVIDRDCARHREEVSAAQRRLTSEQRALAAYRSVRLRRYLRALTIGRP